MVTVVTCKGTAIFISDGTIDTTPGLPFQPNHFVPLMQNSVDDSETDIRNEPFSSEDTEDCHTNTEPPLKKMKRESCSSGKSVL